jgi:hypothetical protein
MNMNAEEVKQEKMLLTALENKCMKAFMELYKNYGEDLLIYAYSQLQDPRLAVQTVDEFFENLWSDAKCMKIKPPIYKSLLARMRVICEQKYNSQL